MTSTETDLINAKTRLPGRKCNRCAASNVMRDSRIPPPQSISTKAAWLGSSMPMAQTTAGTMLFTLAGRDAHAHRGARFDILFRHQVHLAAAGDATEPAVVVVAVQIAGQDAGGVVPRGQR